MGDDVMVRVENVSKRFAKRLRHVMWYGVCDLSRQLAGLAARKDMLRPHEFWSLRDVSFEVQRGECLGIIGSNGAGKSTLLKLINGILRPDAGRLRVRGRVGALIEVGAGFHPLLTGRENVYLNGAILGMSREEIARKFDAIVEFAGIGDFLDMPVKFYSSGMYVRLEFAVAAHLEPDVLLVDEVLAVGDVSFQARCLARMRELVKSGRTLIFISHNLLAVREVCSRCVWLEHGRIRSAGEVASVVHSYLDRSGEAPCSSEMELARWPRRYGAGGVRILSARLLGPGGTPTAVAYRTRPLTVEYVFESQYQSPLNLSAVVVSDDGNRVLHLDQQDMGRGRPGALLGRHRVRFTIPSLPLAAGRFSWQFALQTEFLQPLDVVSEVLPFVVEDVPESPRPYKTTVDQGLCWQPAEWAIHREP